jgi:hypothetical protein
MILGFWFWLACVAPPSEGDTAWSPHLGTSVVWSDVVINEFMARNATGLQDSSEAYPDWIELFNPTEEDIDLEGWTLSDDIDERERHTLVGLSIEAGGWLLLYADGDPDQGDDHLDFSLDVDGEEIGLYSPDGGVVDELEFGALPTDHSAARQIDGGSEWEITDAPTPGSSNGEAR